MNESAQLAAAVCGMSGDLLTPQRLTDIRCKLLDWLGCAIGAAGEPASHRLRRTVAPEAGHGESTVFCSPASYPLLSAAFLNGAESHILECDDVHKTAIAHPGVIAVPSSLAVAELCGSSFGELALGIAAGYEVMIRLGSALGPSHYDHWHTTGTCGTFAAAAAAGRLLGFRPEEMERALGLAATMAAGLVCSFKTDAKLVTVGNAVRCGIQAALLAREGLSAPAAALERPGGYGEAVSRGLDLSALTAHAPPMIDTACYKLYASCGHTHSALDALFALLREHPFQAGDVERIRVSVYSKAAELVGRFQAGSAVEARFSLPYCIAAGILYGAVSVREFQPEALSSARLADLAQRVTVQADTALDAGYPQKRPETVRIALRDGRILEKTVLLPLGRPPYPEIEEKFLSLAGRTISREDALYIRGRVMSARPEEPVRDLINDMKGRIYHGE